MTMKQNHNRVAIVIGGSGGIGKVVAERLATDGLNVVITYNNNPSQANEIVDAIKSRGGSAISIQADVADENDINSLFTTTEKEFGGVDVVVNTAGIMILGSIEEFDLQALDRMHRINIRGTFVTSQLAARRVRSGGAIINFSSSVTKLAMPKYGPYAASKGAVEAISLILARELEGRDITVNAVSPGPTATPLFLEGKNDATIEHLANMNPMKRLGKSEDVAELISFLAGSGRWINGQVIYVNGGMI